MLRTSLALILALALGTALTAAETPLMDGGATAFEKTWIGGSTKALVDAPDQGGKALQLVVTDVPENYWMAQTWVTPLKVAVAEGDTLRITFSARCTAPAGQAGQLSVSVGLNADPYSQAIQEKVTPGAEWKDYTITGVAKTALTAEQGRFGFVYGYQVQTLEIAKIVVVNLGKQ